MDFQKLCLRCMDCTTQNGFCNSCGKPNITTQKPDFALPLQTVLHGRYVIGRVLGYGGFGITYVAYDLVQNRRVAVKELFVNTISMRIPGSTDVGVSQKSDYFAKAEKSFLDEAQMIYSLRDNPKILNVSHIFRENGTAYYVMEYLDGADLKAIISARGGKISWRELAPIIKDVVEALIGVHRQGKAHRDVSPDNIFILKSGIAKLIDFGAARNVCSNKTFSVVIKKGFAPPEQYKAHGNQGPWTDIYALAATIYYCLTGKLVPESPSRYLNDSVIRPNELGAHIPPEVENAVMRGLSLNPAGRFSTAEQFAAALFGGGAALSNGTSYAYTPSNQSALPNKIQWRLKYIKGKYAGAVFNLPAVLVVGRDSTKCNLTYDPNYPGISRLHMQFCINPGDGNVLLQCLSSNGCIYINNVPFSGAGNSRKLKANDYIVFGAGECVQLLP